MLLIRGDTRVADIYMTEFDRIFRHFYFRNVANEIEAHGDEAKGAFLSEDSSWTDGYFKPGAFKSRRREMFFADPTPTWSENAAAGASGARTPGRKAAAKKKRPAAKKAKRKKSKAKTTSAKKKPRKTKSKKKQRRTKR
jgi:hypothetical protein